MTDRSRRPWLRGLFLGGLLLLAGRTPMQAQDQLRDFLKPLLVLDTGGHSAPIRALSFTPDGSQLLTAGFDKVIRIWDLEAERSGLARTLRPPIWRGERGNLYALALQPRPDARGQRLLAVAGLGIESQAGNITLFRFPGSNEHPNGELIDQLLSGDANRPEAPAGHTSTVMSLAFSPDGNRLASASMDGTARLWDVTAAKPKVLAVFRSRRLVPNVVPAVNVAAFVGDRRLVTGNADGFLELWDVDRPNASIVTDRAELRNPRDTIGAQINALAVSRDNRIIAVGREDGLILRYNADDLAGRVVLNGRNEERTIEALALSPDGSKLVTTSVAKLGSAAATPDYHCLVTIRDVAGGGNARGLLNLDQIAYACGFSPDGKTLAVAGGNDQVVYLIRDFQDATRNLGVLPDRDGDRGRGRGIRDVGFARRGLAVGFDRRGNDPRPEATFEGFDLIERELRSFARRDLSRALLTFDGWQVTPIDQYNLEISHPNPPSRRHRIQLDPNVDRRWECYSFIPGDAAAKHPRPTFAVGCKGGVRVYRLDDGQITRIFNGHDGPVMCLAPSPDGRWLATGSTDQTVRLWGLADADRRGPFGAELEVQGKALKARAVTPRGFAQKMGMDAGDVLDVFAIGNDNLTGRPEEFLRRRDLVPPGTFVQFRGTRTIAPLGFPIVEKLEYMTTRRDNPAVSLFVSDDRDWVLWMPAGYYDSTFDGQRENLFWHFNESPYNRPKPTKIVAIGDYRKEFRQPRRADNILNRLLGSGDELAAFFPPVAPPPPNRPRPRPPALIEPARFVAQTEPPAIGLRLAMDARDDRGRPVPKEAAAPDRLVLGPGGLLDLKVGINPAPGRSLPKKVELVVDGTTRREFTTEEIRAAGAAGELPVRITLSPGPHRPVIRATGFEGIETTRGLDVDVAQGPNASQAKGRLVVLTIAPEATDKELAIPFNVNDAEALGPFLQQYAVNGSGAAFGDRVEVRSFQGRAARADALKAAFEKLGAEPFQENDLVLVLLEAHVLDSGGTEGQEILAADSRPRDRRGLNFADVARPLGKIAREKCKVIVLLDGVHVAHVPGWSSSIRQLTEDLTDRGVIVFAASDQGPSQPFLARPGAPQAGSAVGRRTFAQAVLDAIRPNGPTRPQTLFAFRDTVRDEVLARTQRQQFARCYLPPTINGRFLLLNPAAPASLPPQVRR